jgi:hypothetical protein
MKIKRNNLRWLAPCIIITLLLMVLAGNSYSVKYISKKKFVSNNIPKGSKLSKLKVNLKEEHKKILAEKWSLKKPVEDLLLIIGRDDSAKVTGIVCITTVYATEHNCVHHLAIALKPDGSVKEVVITETFCEYAMKCASQSFLGQFRKKSMKKLILNKDINAVTGVTESSQRIVDAVNTTMAYFLEYVKKK